jgi:hypothetical protein
MRRFACGLTMALLLACVGCGGLSRSTARDLIAQNIASQTVTRYVYLRQQREEAIKNDTGEVGALYRLGYLRCEIIPASSDTSNPYFPLYTPEECRPVLSDKGQAAAAQWEVSRNPMNPDVIVRLKLPVATLEVIEVTGITEKENDATATYTWREKPLNDIGEALGYGQVQQGEMQFKKYDDGWRPVIYSIPSLTMP